MLKSSCRTLVQRFSDACFAIPPPGTGCHPALLGAASRGVFANLTDPEILQEIRRSVPAGKRRVDDREILEAIDKARRTITRATGAGQASARMPRQSPVRPAAPSIDWAKVRGNIIAKGGGAIDPDDADIWESSPMRLPMEPGLQDTVQFLRSGIYSMAEFLYIGNKMESPKTGEQQKHVKPVSAWAEFFEQEAVRIATLGEREQFNAELKLGMRFPFVGANPLTGEVGRTLAGEPSFRSDDNVAAFRFLVAEFDKIPKGEQIAFFKGLGLAVSAMIDTGGKSVHCWIRVNARDRREWEALVENNMFRQLAHLGLDSACKNESRLSRLPGVLRMKEQDGKMVWSGNRQRLLWLCPDTQGRVL